MPKTICSIFFQPRTTTRPYALQQTTPGSNTPGGYNHRFSIAAAKPGEYETCIVPDVMYEYQYIFKGKTMSSPVFADHVAPCIVGEWRDVVNHNEGGPGIFICAGDTPTPAELKSARARQSLWCEKLVNEAEGAWINGKRDEIKQLHRDAATYLGRLSFAWMQDDGEVVLVNCPSCYSKINSAASVCAVCRNIVDFSRHQEQMLKHAKMQAELDAAIKKFQASEQAAPEPVKPITAPPLQPNAPKQASR